MEVVRVVKLYPEGDGSHPLVVEEHQAFDVFKDWGLLECGVPLGDRYVMEWSEMTRQELGALPEHDGW